MGDAERKADHALAILDGLADKWEAEVDLTSMIKNAVSPMSLNRNAPPDVIAKFTHSVEVQINAIARQAFIEGAYRAITGLQDERQEMKRRGTRCVDDEAAMAKHTPGPLQLVEAKQPLGNGLWPVYVADANGRKIANCFGGADEREANARLWVEAPKLYEALEQIERMGGYAAGIAAAALLKLRS